MEHVKKHYENLFKSIENNFKSRNINAKFFNEKKAALKYIMSLIKDGQSIGYGGSMTLENIGVLDDLRARNVVLYDRGREGISKDEKESFQKKALTADIFLSGVNALTQKGVLHFIDCIGNRVGPILYGPDKVILVCGVNKICPDDDYAYKRIQTYASPVNCIRLNRNNPCAKTGLHVDCRSDGRICSFYTRIDFNAVKDRIELVIINEDLGY